MRVGITAAVGAVFALSFAFPAEAASIGEKTAQKQAEIPTCTHKLGTLAVREPQNRWWDGLGLESPEALLGWCGTLAPLFVRPADLVPPPYLWVGVAAQGIGNILAVMGICDLGRSFGIVAAHRGIKIGGLYRYLRHPIYAAYLLAFGGFVLAHPSVFNSLVLLVWAIIQIARIHAEERMLGEDPTYCAYRRAVRYRLVPGLW